MSRNRLATLAAVVIAVSAILAALVLRPNGDDGAPGSARNGAVQTGTNAPTASDEQIAGDTDGGLNDVGGDDLPEAGAASEVAVSAEGGAAQEDPELQREARSFVEELAQSSDQPLAVDRLDAFVTPDRPLATEINEPEVDEAAASRAPSQAAERNRVSAASAGGEVDQAGETNASTEAGDAAAGEENQSLVDLPLNEEVPITIAQILGAEEVTASDAVFYVHTVQPDDDQGIWGIIHKGIINNFAEGVAMRRGGESKTYRIDIPKDADEIEEQDNSSSFLGRLIHEKSVRTWVYNFETNRVGKNPQMILPGQEIVIVSFTPEELIAIYKHFVQQQELE